MEAKFWLGYLVGQNENTYFDNSKLTYYWYSDNGIKLAIESNHKIGPMKIYQIFGRFGLTGEIPSYFVIRVRYT